MTKGTQDISSGDTTMTACPFYHIKGCDSLYIDFLEAPKEVVRLYAATPVKKRKGPRGGVSDPFPNKLREMLLAASREGLNEIVDWKHHGRSFGIYDPETFVRDVLPRFFKQTKLTSFQRQLNLYGFLRVTSGPEQGCYFHPMFLQSRPDLLPIMVRDRTNPWTKLAEPHEAMACNTFADIRPQSLLGMKGATSFPPNETQEASNHDEADFFIEGVDFDIPPQSLLGMKVFDATSFAPNESQEASNNDQTDSVIEGVDFDIRPQSLIGMKGFDALSFAKDETDSFMGDDFVDMLDAVFEMDDPDDVFFYKVFFADQDPSTNDPHDLINVVSPNSSDVDDSTDDESLTGSFAGQRFHCVNNEEKALALEPNYPSYRL